MPTAFLIEPNAVGADRHYCCFGLGGGILMCTRPPQQSETENPDADMVKTHELVHEYSHPLTVTGVDSAFAAPANISPENTTVVAVSSVIAFDIPFPLYEK